MLFVTFIFRNFCFPYRSTDNVFTVFADSIFRMIKTTGATQAVVIDIKELSESSTYKSFHKFSSYGVLKRFFIF